VKAKVKKMSAYDLLGKRLKGKVAIVTASSKGIGLAIAERFVAEGWLTLMRFILKKKRDLKCPHVCDLSSGANVVVSSRKQENVDEAVDFLRKVAKVSEDLQSGLHLFFM